MSIALPEKVRLEWLRCNTCGELVYRKRWLRGLRTCPYCRHSDRLPVRDRIALLADPGSFAELSVDAGAPDPLRFVDEIPYTERRARAERATGEREAVVCGSATVAGHPTVLAVMEFGFMGGSLGSGAGDLIMAAVDAALAARRPLLLVTASGGARMQEGILSLMQMGRISHGLRDMNEAGLLVLALVTDPTYGGVAASFATQADIILAEPGARLGFAGPRVIRDTIGEDLPPGFQTAEFLLEHGLVDLVVDRTHQAETIGRLLGAVSGPAAPADTSAAPVDPPPVPVTPLVPAGTGRDAWEVVRSARRIDRPTSRDYLHRISDWFVELHGDRRGADSRTVIGGVARIGDRHVVVVAIQKGRDTAELVRTNFGMAGPEGYHKAIRLLALAERLRLPVLTLVDTPGAHPGVEAERHGQSHAIAASLLTLAGLRTPVITVVTGEGGSGGALALAVADRVYMLSGAVYSVISPEGCAAILGKAGDVPRAAAALRLTAADLLDLRVVDGIVAEPDGGAHRDHPATAAELRDTVTRALAEVCALSPEELRHQRRTRWLSFTATMTPAHASTPSGDGRHVHAPGRTPVKGDPTGSAPAAWADGGAG